MKKKMEYRNRIKIRLQFLRYVLFSKGDFNLDVFRRLYFAFWGGFTVNEYYIFNLKENDKAEYLSELDWFKSRMINKPFDIILNNKIVFYEWIKNKVDTPQVFAYKWKAKTVETTNYKSIDELSRLIDLIKINGPVILKPVTEGKGNSVIKLFIDNDENILINNSKVLIHDLERLLMKKKNWIMCEQIIQHEYSHSIYPETANTIRLLIIKDENNNSELVYAVHRFGTNKTGVVDNASQGGLVSKIDLSTGIMSAAKSIRTLEQYDKHPDTGSIIKGVKVPHWKEIKDKILIISNELPFLKMIAWDVCVTQNSFSVVEANSSTGINIIQLWEGQRNKKFGKFLKDNSEIK